MNKSKPIHKNTDKNKKNNSHKQPKKVTDEKGDPLIQNLNDFVTSLKITHSSLPIYTGGRIITTASHIYATCNAEVAVYSYQTDTVIDRIKHKNEEIVNFCVCPHEKFIVTFTQNSLIRVVLLESKKVLHTVKVAGLFANDMGFSPDGRHLALALGNSVHIFTFETMKRTHTYNPTNSKFVINKLQWNPIPQTLQIITCDMQRNIVNFDYILNKVIAVSEAGQGGSDFTLSSSGTTLISLNNLEVKIYETKGLKLKYKFETEQYMESVLLMDGNFLLMGGEETGLMGVDLSAGEVRYRQFDGCTDNGVMKIMRKGNNGKEVVVLSQEQNITVVKIGGTNNVEKNGIIVGFNDEIIDLRSDRRLIEQGEEGTGNNNSNYFIMVTNSNNAKIMNKKTQKLQQLVQGHENTILCTDYWHPYFVTAGKDTILKLWRIVERQGDGISGIKLLANYRGHSADIMSVVALQRSKIIATVSEDNTIKLWTMCLETNEKVEIKSALRTAIAHKKTINAVRVSAKEDMLATCSQDKTVKIWDVNLSNLMTLAGHRRGVWDIAFHPVEKLIVSAGGDGMIKGWNLTTGECVWSMGEGMALIRCQWVYYNQVVTGSIDGIVKIWDIRKQTSIAYDKHEGKIWALDISTPNNPTQSQSQIKTATIMTGATDSIYHIWQDNTSQLKQTIMHRSQLQEQERIFYSQFMEDKKYTEAAIVAFKGNFIKLFLKVLEQMCVKFDPERAVSFDEENDDQLMVGEGDEHEGVVTEGEFREMVAELKSIDVERLLMVIQEMNQTVRHYKMANRLLREVLMTSKFSQLLDLNNKLVMVSKAEEQSMNEFNEKKSGMQKWLESMISSGMKHTNRVEKYIRGTYWIEHLYKQENPLLR